MLHATKRARKGETSKPASPVLPEIPPTVENADFMASLPDGYSDKPVVRIWSKSPQTQDVCIALDANAIAALYMARELDHLSAYFDEIEPLRPGFDAVLLRQAEEAYKNLHEKLWAMARSAVACV